MIYRLGEKEVKMGTGCFIAPDASLIGDVTLADNVSIWFNAVLRADAGPITVDEKSNIQDGVVCHVEKEHPLHIGKNVTVGHKAMLHGCTIGDNCIVGINSVIMNGAKIGENCIIGSGTLVTEGKEIPPGSLVLGAPGKVIRQLSPEQLQMVADSAETYVKNSARFLQDLEAQG